MPAAVQPTRVHGRASLLVAVGAVLALAAFPLVTAGRARASELISRDATSVRLSVDGRGRALVEYRARGARRRVLAWGAVNARPPSPSTQQVRFRLRYGHSRAARGGCGHYDGPALAWLVAACKAPDGSYWALQSWRRLARPGDRLTGPRELRLSHWNGELAVLEATVGWLRNGVHHLTGSLTYVGQPVFGFGATPSGRPLDKFGRNVYLDTFNSAYGRGWRRENGFLTRRPTGRFCYGFFARGRGPHGMGRAYRATVVGPGVTPDVSWTGMAPSRALRGAATSKRCG